MAKIKCSIIIISITLHHSLMYVVYLDLLYWLSIITHRIGNDYPSYTMYPCTTYALKHDLTTVV